MSPLENQLSKKPEVCKTYGETINQYLIKRYIEKVDTTKECHFLVHSPVVRTDKDTTKTRIVFDVSAKKDGISVNDLIHARPKLQNDLLDVLILFRRNAIAVACDISERYLQIQLNSSKSNTYIIQIFRSLQTPLIRTQIFPKIIKMEKIRRSPGRIFHDVIRILLSKSDPKNRTF